MRESQVNNGVSGCRNYNPEVTRSLEDEIARIKRIYPVSAIIMDLADRSDKRWDKYNGKEKKKV